MSIEPGMPKASDLAIKRVAKLAALYDAESDGLYDWLDDPYGYAGWLYSRFKKGLIKESTFKKQIDWSAQVAISEGYPGAASVIRQVRQDRPEEALTVKVPNTPKGKKKKKERKRDIAAAIYPTDITALNEYLRERRPSTGELRLRHGDTTAAWLYAGMVCGLRPSEWRTARLIKNYQSSSNEKFDWVLEVDTAHKGQRREQDKLIRQLVLSDFEDTERDFIRFFAEMLTLPPKDFRKLYQACADTLKGACKKLFDDPTRITLNSGRHLFASEVRRERKINRYGLAAMLGHSDSMNLKHYGDIRPDDFRRFDHPLPTPVPSAAERVEKVDRERYFIIYGKTMTDRMFKDRDMSVNME